VKVKKFFKAHRVLGISLVVLLTLVIAASAYAASLTLTFHNTVDIAAAPGPSPAPAITATYSVNGGPSTALNNGDLISWGSIVQGGSKQMVITFTNSGTASGSETISLPSSMSWCSFSSNGTTVTIPAGGSLAVTLTLSIGSSAPVGTNNNPGDVTITGS
jgi:hypothetical protein